MKPRRFQLRGSQRDDATLTAVLPTQDLDIVAHLCAPLRRLKGGIDRSLPDLRERLRRLERERRLVKLVVFDLASQRHLCLKKDMLQQCAQVRHLRHCHHCTRSLRSTCSSIARDAVAYSSAYIVRHAGPAAALKDGDGHAQHQRVACDAQPVLIAQHLVLHVVHEGVSLLLHLEALRDHLLLLGVG
eukprot:6498013-Prymnesium_polylepis.1